jgi:hypothetical protein
MGASEIHQMQSAEAEAAEVKAESLEPRPAAKHVGVLVIHGIGTEDSYSTLDQFARGLYRHYGGNTVPSYTMATEWNRRAADPAHQQKFWTQAQIRFDATPAADPEQPQRITMAEYYWSPATKGKIKDIAVLTWLFRTGIEPFRYLYENLRVMQISGRNAASRARTGRFLFGREIARLFFLYPPLLFSFAAVAAFLSQTTAILNSLKEILHDPSNYFLGLGIALRLLLVASLGLYAHSAFQWRRRRTTDTPSSRHTPPTLAIAILLAGILFFWFAGAFHAPPHKPWPPPVLTLDRFSSLIAHLFPHQRSFSTGLAAFFLKVQFVWRLVAAWVGQLFLLKKPFTDAGVPLVELGIAAVIRSFLIDFLGDVAIYTNLNQRVTYFATRAQILEECGNAITALYTDMFEEAVARKLTASPGRSEEDVRASIDASDFQLVIAAHSLGSVIAYDSVNELFNRARIALTAHQPDPAALLYSHFKGMLTFGSPLNKTYYFFRDQSSAEALIRSQIIDGLHSFRLRSPDRELPGAPLRPYPDPLRAWAARFLWINIWAKADIFSGRLFFYDLPDNCQVCRPYKIPVFAHLEYWTDEEMYAIFAQRLL